MAADSSPVSPIDWLSHVLELGDGDARKSANQIRAVRMSNTAHASHMWLAGLSNLTESIAGKTKHEIHSRGRLDGRLGRV
jgi:hypothetical protein